jgi:lipopolysaccharide transport system ATP-binding protein
VGIYLFTTRGEYVFTSFDTDSPEKYDRYSIRQPGHYVSRCVIPKDFLNEGRYVLGVNASSYRVKRYFQDEQALTLNVDAAGSPGMQWLEQRFGPIRPRLNWDIETLKA